MKVLLLSVLLIVLLHCHGGLSMMGAQGGDDENQRYANLHELVKKIRDDLLNRGIIEGRMQFAFLLLGDDTLLNSVRSFSPNPSLLFARLNRNRNRYNDLLVAIPKGPRHAEIILLSELYPLYKAYMKKHDHSPEFILLYSNRMPCESCTTEIINSKNSRGAQMPGVKWFVGYHVGNSTRVPDINDQTTKENVARLKANGIRVFKVNFLETPSLFSEIEQRKREHIQ